MPRIVLFALLLFVPLFGEDAMVDSSVMMADTGSADSMTTPAVQTVTDTLVDSTVTIEAAPVDSVKPDSAAVVQKSAPVADTIGEKEIEVTEKNEVTTTTTVKKIKLRKRNFNYRQQVVLAVGMMAFIAIMMTTAQSLNPK